MVDPTVPSEITPHPASDDLVCLTQPQLIHDGQCGQHYLVARFTDVDGMVNCLCSKCPMGDLFNPQTHVLKDGHIYDQSSH